MYYSVDEVMDYVREEDVKFIRLAFCDAYGCQKNVSIMPSELSRAFADGISIDASAVRGFGDLAHSDMFAYPDPSTLQVLPWRPAHGRVIRMFCDLRRPDGTPSPADSRRVLREAVDALAARGLTAHIGAEFEFYLFKTDENGEPTAIPHDRAGYMDVAPEDRGENVRREICLALEQMGIQPESSHHEEGPGQHEIDFHYSDPLSAADNAVTFKAAVRTIAAQNGLYASLSPKPIVGEPGNGLHINLSVDAADGKDYIPAFIAGILAHVQEITAVLNPTEESYRRLGKRKAPKFLSWSPENRSQLIRIPATHDGHRRIELRSPDPGCNPYLAYALLLRAGLDGVERGLTPPEPVNEDLFHAPAALLERLETLPATLEEAWARARGSEFLRQILPPTLLACYT